MLTFEDPKEPDTRNIWKTAFGGFITITFGIVVASYLSVSFVALDSGDMDIISSQEQELSLSLLNDTDLNFETMRVMPVVTFNM